MTWPRTREELERVQLELAARAPDPWHPPDAPLAAGGVFAAFADDRLWVAAAVLRQGGVVARVVLGGEAGAPYEPGMLALREGRALEAAVRALPEPPDVLLVNATGRDHPRGAGLALHLGAVLDVPTIGVTDRALHVPPGTVSREVAVRSGARALIVHAAWRTDVDTAVTVVRRVTTKARTPEPLREARRLARTARATG